MSILEDFGRKANEIGQRAALKTRELSETARLNGMISDAERKIEDTYYQIGKTYVEIHKDDPEEALSSMVQTICEEENKITVCRQQILTLRRVRRCEVCGAEVSTTAAFCVNCGNPLPKVDDVPDGFVKCMGCGSLVNKDMRFCPTCGKPIEIQEDVQESDEPNLPVYIFCPNCGKKTASDSIFCIECGERLPENLPQIKYPAPAQQDAPTAVKPVKTCPKCGTTIDADMQFCSECGTRI